MKTYRQFSLLFLGVILMTFTAISPAMAATNQANDPGGGGITLTASGNVTITSATLSLVKAVYTTGGSCLATDNADATCNGGATAVSVPAGTQLDFVIYVKNTSAITATNVRFRDLIRDVTAGADYFTYSVGTIQYDNSQDAATSTLADIYTAVSSGTAQTDAFDGSTQVDEFCAIDTTVSPDNLLCGGDASSPDNDQIDLIADRTFAIIFRVTKTD
jgi:uncharacterized repeat protein (TIGR01451 family)